jgi:hypothetical protein
MISLKPRTREPKIRKERKPRIGKRERVYVFDPERTFSVRMPVKTLLEKLDHRSRFTPGRGWFILIGFLFTTLAVSVAAFPFFSLVQALPLEYAILYSLGVGVGGGIPGALVGLKLSPGPFWVIHRYRDGNEVIIESWIHPHLMGHEDVIWVNTKTGLPVNPASVKLRTVYLDPITGEIYDELPDNPDIVSRMETREVATADDAPVEPQPRVYRASSMAEDLEGRDYKNELKGSNKTNLQKLEVGILAVTCIALFVIIFLFVTSQGAA